MTEFGKITHVEKHISRCQPRPHAKGAGLQHPQIFLNPLPTPTLTCSDEIWYGNTGREERVSRVLATSPSQGSGAPASPKFWDFL